MARVTEIPTSHLLHEKISTRSRRFFNLLRLTLLTVIILTLLSPVKTFSAPTSNITFSPSPYSGISQLPDVVKITFTEKLNKSTGELILLDPLGRNLITKSLLTENSISASPSKTLYSGDYLILFTVLTTDGTTLTGSSSFTLLPSAKNTPLPDSLKKLDQGVKASPLTPLKKDYSKDRDLFFITLLLLPISLLIFTFLKQDKNLLGASTLSIPKRRKKSL